MDSFVAEIFRYRLFTDLVDLESGQIVFVQFEPSKVGRKVYRATGAHDAMQSGQKFQMSFLHIPIIVGSLAVGVGRWVDDRQIELLIRVPQELYRIIADKLMVA